MDLSYKSCRGSPRRSVRHQGLTQSVAPDAKRHDRDVDRNSDVMNDVAVARPRNVGTWTIYKYIYYYHCVIIPKIVYNFISKY